MGKLESVATRKQAYLDAQDVALEAYGEGCYDDGVASVPPADADEQAKIDAAVAAAVDPLNAQIASLQAQDAADVAMAQAAQAQVVSIQAQLDAMTAKDATDLQSLADAQALVTNFKAQVDGFQSSLDAIKAFLATLTPPPTP